MCDKLLVGEGHLLQPYLWDCCLEDWIIHYQTVLKMSGDQTQITAWDLSYLLLGYICMKHTPGHVWVSNHSVFWQMPDTHRKAFHPRAKNTVESFKIVKKIEIMWLVIINYVSYSIPWCCWHFCTKYMQSYSFYKCKLLLSSINMSTTDLPKL